MTTSSTWSVWGKRSTPHARTGTKASPINAFEGALHKFTELFTKDLGLQLMYTSRLIWEHFRNARITSLWRPARGGSTTAIQGAPRGTCSSMAACNTFSALPATNTQLPMLLRFALRRASSTALSFISTPMTRCTERAIHMPIVPVPQHTSSKTVLGEGSHHSRTMLYSLSAQGVFTWKKALGDIRNLRSNSKSWIKKRP
mmetsp:Transcript_7800/g.12480  ORF Transcript_7800/g.12480 Transcript_7800/m.12480 type:complete len:200 (-) Transcript_7800:1179-1778(-)